MFRSFYSSLPKDGGRSLYSSHTPQYVFFRFFFSPKTPLLKHNYSNLDSFFLCFPLQTSVGWLSAGDVNAGLCPRA